MTTLQTLNSIECFKLLDELIRGFGTGGGKIRAVRNHLLGVLMLDTGMRVGEVVRLQVRDLYFNSEPVKSIIIRAEIAKNHVERQIPVSVRLCQALEDRFEHITHRGEMFTNFFIFNRGDPRRPLTCRQVERIIRAAAIRSLSRPIHPHILRHTFATRLMRITDMRTVQILLGHKNLSSTQVYTHPNSDDLRNAINALPDIEPNNISQQT